MNRNHEDFEVLCALTMNGNLTRMEHAELREHLENCVFCHIRLVEMRRVAIHLLLAQPHKNPRKLLGKGMRERFVARAISEGIPLSPRSQGVGFSALGLVTVLMVVLLLVTATLGDGPYRSVFKTDVGDTARVSALIANKKVSTEDTVTDPPGKVRTGHVLNRHVRRGGNGPLPGTFRATGPGLPKSEPGVWQSRQFTFTPYSRNSATRPYPLSTNQSLSEVVPSLVFPDRVSELRLDATSEVFRRNAPHLLAESGRGVFGSPAYRSDAFHILHVVVPQSSDQERPQ
jgi:hypothetical protein